MAQLKGEGLKFGFESSLSLEFHGSNVTTDAGLLACRDLDEVLRLFDSVSKVLSDARTGRNIQHGIENLLGQSAYTRPAGYEDVNDATRMSKDPVIRTITGKKKVKRNAAGTNTMGRFETEMPTVTKNLKALSEINGRWVQRAMAKTNTSQINS